MEVNDLVWKDFQHFAQFVVDIILPVEPPSHVAHSDFHKMLMYYACHPLSVTAAPRGCLKSTIFAKYRVLHRLIDPTPGTNLTGKIDIMLVSETAKIAREHLDWIKWHLINNDKLNSKYKKVADPTRSKWNEDEVELLNGNRVMALGSEGQIRGWHPTDIIVDDLESTKNMGTEESLKKLKDWFYRSLMGTMLPETRLTAIGTIIARESLLSELVRKDGFRGNIWEALQESKDGKLSSIWPERWSLKWLLERKKQLGTHRFNAEYQNKPIGLGDPIVWPEWIRRHTDNDLAALTPVRRYIACDPAFTEERWGNYSAIVVLDEVPGKGIFERLAWRKKVATPDLVRTIRDFYYHFKSNCPNIKIGIEEVAAQKSIRQSIQEIDPELGGLIIPLRPDKDKVRRLADVSRYFEAGYVSLKTESMIDEIIDFPARDKDRVDALVYCLKMYEQDHPILVKHQEVIDPIKELGQTELELYLDRQQRGVPNHEISAEYLQRYEDVQMIMDYFES